MKKNKKRNWLSKIRNDPESFETVPEDLKSVEFCLTAVKNDSRAFPYVPDSLKTEVVCLAAVKQNSRMLEYVPGSLKTKAVCLAALNKTAKAHKYMPEILKAKLSPIYTVRLTDDEIDIINVWAKGFCDSNGNKVMEINEIIWKENKEFLIDSSTQSKLINISCIANSFYAILSIKFSENNTKATLKYSAGAGPLGGIGLAVDFSKENNIWKETEKILLGIS